MVKYYSNNKWESMPLGYAGIIKYFKVNNDKLYHYRESKNYTGWIETGYKIKDLSLKEISEEEFLLGII